MTFDCFMFFNELDLLEIRLNILDPYVDVFLIGEAHETFSGKPKPLYFKENAKRFSKWKHKIVHLEILNSEAKDSFDRAYHQKESLKNALESFAQDEDIVYYGDLDEIWKPKKIEDDKIYNLEQLNYCYYLNNKSSERWVGTIVGKWGTIKNMDFRYWRASHTNELPDGGWHFTNMGGVEQIKKKLESYDHVEMDTRENHVLLEDRIKDGEDYVGRDFDWEGKPFTFHIDESGLPKYIIDNKLRYAHFFK